MSRETADNSDCAHKMIQQNKTQLVPKRPAQSPASLVLAGGVKMPVMAREFQSKFYKVLNRLVNSMN